jgi:uncharacterized protein
MNLEIEHRIPRPRDRVFRALTDAAGLAVLLPAVERFEAVGTGEFHVLFRAPGPPTATTWVGTFAILERNEPESFWIGGDLFGEAGSIRGDAWVSLEEDEGGTRVRVAASVELEGAVAAAGRNRLTGAARELASGVYEAIARGTEAERGSAAEERRPFGTIRERLARFVGAAVSAEPRARDGWRNA